MLAAITARTILYVICRVVGRDANQVQLHPVVPACFPASSADPRGVAVGHLIFLRLRIPAAFALGWLPCLDSQGVLCIEDWVRPRVPTFADSRGAGMRFSMGLSISCLRTPVAAHVWFHSGSSLRILVALSSMEGVVAMIERQ